MGLGFSRFSEKHSRVTLVGFIGFSRVSDKHSRVTLGVPVRVLWEA